MPRADRGMRAAAAAHKANRYPIGGAEAENIARILRSLSPGDRRTLSEIILQHLNFGRGLKNNPLMQLRFMSLALCGEAGELANLIKKQWRGDRKYKGARGKAAWRAAVRAEIFDCANYVFMLAKTFGLDFDEVTEGMREKFLEVEGRDDDWNHKFKRPKGPPFNCRCVDPKTLARAARRIGGLMPAKKRRRK